MTQFFLSQSQRNTLAVVVEHIFDFDRRRRDAQHFVMAIDDVAFSRDEDVFALRQENLLGLAGSAGESEELQVNWQWRRWLRRAVFRGQLT